MKEMVILRERGGELKNESEYLDGRHSSPAELARMGFTLLVNTPKLMIATCDRPGYVPLMIYIHKDLLKGVV